MRLTSPMFAGTNGQTQPKQSILMQSTTKGSGLLQSLPEDTVAFSRKSQNPPRFGMEDVPAFQHLPRDWDAKLRRAMREAVNQEGGSASVSKVLFEFERQYGALPKYVLGQRSTRPISMVEKLGATKTNQLEAKNRTGGSPPVDDQIRSIKWTPCEDTSLAANRHESRNMRRRAERERQQAEPLVSLPSFAEVSAQAGIERNLSTENNYPPYYPTWGRY